LSTDPKPSALVLLAAAMLQVGARRLRALAMGDDAALREWLQAESAHRLAETRRDARAALAAVEALGARMVALGDADYPPGLRDLRDAPAFLIVRGELATGGTAIVGTRNPSEFGAAMAGEIARRIAPPIVAGLAHGIDAAAHRAAVEARIATIAYVGNGLGATYPPDHRDLEEAIVASGGAVASERLPGERATRWSLMRRDRLQAAHAGAIVLIESEKDGGAMHAMRFAAVIGRPRFALEPRQGTPTVGNAWAIAEGARALPWDAAAAARIVGLGGAGGATEAPCSTR
jgi:DNA processing protein